MSSRSPNTSTSPVPHGAGRGGRGTPLGVAPPPYGRSPSGTSSPNPQPGTPTVGVSVGGQHQSTSKHRPPSPDYATAISQSALVPTGSSPPAAAPPPPQQTVVVGHHHHHHHQHPSAGSYGGHHHHHHHHHQQVASTAGHYGGAPPSPSHSHHHHHHHHHHHASYGSGGYGGGVNTSSSSSSAAMLGGYDPNSSYDPNSISPYQQASSPPPPSTLAAGGYGEGGYGAPPPAPAAGGVLPPSTSSYNPNNSYDPSSGGAGTGGADPFSFMRAPSGESTAAGGYGGGYGGGVDPQQQQQMATYGGGTHYPEQQQQPVKPKRSRRSRGKGGGGGGTPNNNSMVNFAPDVIMGTDAPHHADENDYGDVVGGAEGAAPSAFGVMNTSSNNHSFGNTSAHSGGAAADTISDNDSLHSGASSSMISGSSIREDLPLCNEDDGCPLINDKLHQRQYAHTCRLYPCYHGNLKFHAKLFRHQPGQCLDPPGSGNSSPQGSTSNIGEGSDTSGRTGGSGAISTRQRRRIRKSLKSVNFSYISPNVPNAVTISVTCPKMKGDVAYEIAGDWTQVKLHSFKRYLHQVFNVPPVQQQLMLDYTTELEDDLSSVAELGIVTGSVIHIVVKDEEGGDGNGASSAATPKHGGGGGVDNSSFMSSDVNVGVMPLKVRTSSLLGDDTTSGIGQTVVTPKVAVAEAVPKEKRSKISLDDL